MGASSHRSMMLYERGQASHQHSSRTRTRVLPAGPLGGSQGTAASRPPTGIDPAIRHDEQGCGEGPRRGKTWAQMFKGLPEQRGGHLPHLEEMGVEGRGEWRCGGEERRAVGSFRLRCRKLVSDWNLSRRKRERYDSIPSTRQVTWMA